MFDEIKILRYSWWLSRRKIPPESPTFEGSNSSHITNTFKQEKDKAAKEERQEGGGQRRQKNFVRWRGIRYFRVRF